MPTRKAGNQWLCAKHYRFKQMRASAKSRGKYQPTWNELESLNKSMACPDCSRAMGWFRSSHGNAVISLQHYTDGTLALVCLRCNVQHGRMPGDSWRDLPAGQKLCQKCGIVKPDEQFNVDSRASAVKKRATSCKACMLKTGAAWASRNPEKVRAIARKSMAKSRAKRANQSIN